MSGRREKKIDEPIDQAWAVSYGDLMTLLMTFFILIVSFSTTELIKFRKAMGSLQGSRGVLMEQDGSSVVHKSVNSPPIADRTVLMRTMEKIEKEVFESEAEGSVDISIMMEGVKFRIYDDLMFEPGKTDVKPTAKKVLMMIGQFIYDFSCDIRVEGHTDNIPINTVRFPSNWELSAVRAVGVVRYFTDELYLDPLRFTAVACGEHSPMLPNTLPANRAKNRRVEIILDWSKYLGEDTI